jgi:sialate O-acetylesterase
VKIGRLYAAHAEGYTVRIMTTTLQIAPIFSDNMVLQREKDLPIYGGGQDGFQVRLCFNGISLNTKVRNGRWLLTLPPQQAGTRGTLEITDGQSSFCFSNVVFGDVWLAGGQSNMELELQNCLNGKAELAASFNPDIRFYQALKQVYGTEGFHENERQCRWHVCAQDSAATLSAVAFFFARKINAETGIPIGIINCNWGGTSISAWLSEEQLSRSAAGKKYLDDYAALVGNKTDEQYEQEMQEYFAQWSAWDKRVQERRALDPLVSWEVLNKECGECPWPQPAGKKSPFRPTNLYHSMIRRVSPFALKGFLYYQGEEDYTRASDYGEMMCYLIDQWRTDWHDDGLPFLFVQLPMYASRAEMEAGLDKDESWQIIRENQYKVSRLIANTGLAVIIDKGEFDNIHPLDKQTVGFRLALQALKKVYGRKISADGPIFKRVERISGGVIRVYFDHAELGLEAHGSLEGFELAGSDLRYYAAQAVIEGSTVALSADEVSEPEHFRYAWYKYGPTPLFGKNGLAAMPFQASLF